MLWVSNSFKGAWLMYKKVYLKKPPKANKQHKQKP